MITESQLFTAVMMLLAFGIGAFSTTYDNVKTIETLDKSGFSVCIAGDVSRPSLRQSSAKGREGNR